MSHDPFVYTAAQYENALAQCAAAVARAVAAETALAAIDPEQVARLFHDSYESLASQYGYETRRDSAVPWEQVPEKNRELMVATASAVLRALLDVPDQPNPTAKGTDDA